MDSHLSDEEKARLSGQVLEYTKTEESLEDQLKLYHIKQQQLKVVSPIDGQVLSWQIRDKLLHRPVEKGQVLMTVADPAGQWELGNPYAGDGNHATNAGGVASRIGSFQCHDLHVLSWLI